MDIVHARPLAKGTNFKSKLPSVSGRSGASGVYVFSGCGLGVVVGAVVGWLGVGGGSRYRWMCSCASRGGVCESGRVRVCMGRVEVWLWGSGVEMRVCICVCVGVEVGEGDWG